RPTRPLASAGHRRLHLSTDGDDRRCRDRVVDRAVRRYSQQPVDQLWREVFRQADPQVDAGDTSRPVSGEHPTSLDAETVLGKGVALQETPGIERDAGRQGADEDLRGGGAAVTAVRLIHHHLMTTDGY